MPERIAAWRQTRGWSLRALAEASGVSIAMLSEIERGTKNPTVKLAYQIAQALDCSISELVEGPAAPPTADRRRRKGAVLDAPGVRRVGHTPRALGGALEVVHYTLEPQAAVGPLEPNRPGTRETVLVLAGELVLSLDGRDYPLLADERRSHGAVETGYRNPSPDRVVEFLVLIDSSHGAEG